MSKFSYEDKTQKHTDWIYQAMFWASVIGFTAIGMIVLNRVSSSPPIVVDKGDIIGGIAVALFFICIIFAVYFTSIYLAIRIFKYIEEHLA